MSLESLSGILAGVGFLLPGIPVFIAVRCAERGAAGRPVAYAQLSLAAWLGFDSASALAMPLSLSLSVGMAAITWLAAVGLEGDLRRAKPASLACWACVVLTLVLMSGISGEVLDAATAGQVEQWLPALCMMGLLGAGFHALRFPLLRSPAPGLSVAAAALAFALPVLATIGGTLGVQHSTLSLSATFLPISLLFGWLLSPRLAAPTKASTSIDPMFIVESGRGLVHSNESGYRLLHVREGDLHAARAAMASIPELRKIVAEEHRECGEFFAGKSAATRRCYEVRASRAEGASGGLRVLTVQDVTARKESERRLYHEAHFDSLTGLANRRYFVRRLGEAIEQKGEDGELRAALMLLDLDRFKEVNDSYGHPAGDELLRIIAHRLRQHLRQEDYVAPGKESGDSWIARLGGDEFAILLLGFETQADVEHVAERVLRLVGDPVVLQGRKLWMTGSLGIALYPDDALEIGDLTSRADIALYKAKASNRSGFEFYNPSLTVETQRKAALDRRLRGAIEEGELSLHYQAKVDLATRKIKGAEALLRWDSEEHGSVLPKDFIPIAEEYGFIDRLGNWVLDRACAQIAEWRSAGIQPVPISVNVSSLQFQQVDLMRVVAAALTSHDLDPSLLEIELTESAVLDGDDNAIVLCLEQLRSIGVKISLDDFGTGYSALGYLSRVPLDVVKLDRAFIRDVHLDPGSAGVVTAVVSMAHSLNLEVVAEGVDCVEQLEVLVSSGCDLVQGFIFGPAVPAEAFATLLGQSVMEIAGAKPARSRPTAVANLAANHGDLPDSDREDVWKLPEEDSDDALPVSAEAAPERAAETDDRYVLVVDDAAGSLGLLALRLNRLGFLALYARVADEAMLFAMQEAGRISTLLVSSKMDAEELRALIGRLTNPSDGTGPSLLFAGDEHPSKAHRELCSEGRVWAVREPIDDSELVFVVRMAITEFSHRSLRLRARAPVDLMTTIRQSGDDEPRAGVMTSLSSGGAYIACHPLPVRSIVDLEFALEDGPVSVRGQVLYVGDDADLGELGIGVSFTSLDEATEARIEASVEARSLRCLA
jgi:diguanylate cyclase (GGDEF)-like protein